jgi:hypothetical protein
MYNKKKKRIINMIKMYKILTIKNNKIDTLNINE